ncbi:MAG TPA: hypothetical protein VK168_12795 [Saprospiraceae bacterium]|nr:hypothetical protein [Saprospiraceae bacterium]
MLQGNLDQDEENELVLWIEGDMLGSAVCFDHQVEHWTKLGEIVLSFFHGNNPPSIDNQAKMLLTYDYGWGSGYGSEVLNFCQARNDSLYYVLQLLETETVWVSGSTAHRVIHTTYKVISPEKIEAVLVYRVLAGDDMGRYSGKTIFSQNLVLEHHWDKDQKRFLPAQYPGLTGDDYITDGEFELDALFAEEIRKLKFHGPKWKRRALGNAEED